MIKSNITRNGKHRRKLQFTEYVYKKKGKKKETKTDPSLPETRCPIVPPKETILYTHLSTYPPTYLPISYLYPLILIRAAIASVNEYCVNVPSLPVTSPFWASYLLPQREYLYTKILKVAARVDDALHTYIHTFMHSYVHTRTHTFFYASLSESRVSIVRARSELLRTTPESLHLISTKDVYSRIFIMFYKTEMRNYIYIYIYIHISALSFPRIKARERKRCSYTNKRRREKEEDKKKITRI